MTPAFEKPGGSTLSDARRRTAFETTAGTFAISRPYPTVSRLLVGSPWCQLCLSCGRKCQCGARDFLLARQLSVELHAGVLEGRIRVGLDVERDQVIFAADNISRSGRRQSARHSVEPGAGRLCRDQDSGLRGRWRSRLCSVPCLLVGRFVLGEGGRHNANLVENLLALRHSQVHEWQQWIDSSRVFGGEFLDLLIRTASELPGMASSTA